MGKLLDMPVCRAVRALLKGAPRMFRFSSARLQMCAVVSASKLDAELVHKLYAVVYNVTV
jgi:hypothetical protein